MAKMANPTDVDEKIVVTDFNSFVQWLKNRQFCTICEIEKLTGFKPSKIRSMVHSSVLKRIPYINKPWTFDVREVWRVFFQPTYNIEKQNCSLKSKYIRQKSASRSSYGKDDDSWLAS